MGTYNLVVCAGHCGSKWLATVLGAQPDVTAYHELRQRMGPGPWHEALQYEPEDSANAAYFTRVGRELEQGDVWDSGGWGLHEVLSVNDLLPIHRIVYLIRHPILQLHSMWWGSGVWREFPLEHYVFEEWLWALWEICPRLPDYADRTRWGKTCTAVAANAYGPDHLRRFGFDVEMITLESLVTDTAVVHALAPRLAPDAIRFFQQCDINRKIDGDRSPDTLWASWTAAMRAEFTDICDDVMDRYGYAWPDEVTTHVSA